MRCVALYTNLLFVFIVKALLVGYRREELACSVESLQFNLGFKPDLSLHHYINYLISIIALFLDGRDVSELMHIINDEGRGAVAQTFLERNKVIVAAGALPKGKTSLGWTRKPRI